MGSIDILLWGIALLIGILATAGYGVLALTPADFRKTRYCFIAAGTLAIIGVILWGSTTTVGQIPRILIIALLSAICVPLTVESIRWVNNREMMSAPKAEKTVAELGISAMVTDASYPIGTTIFGIAFRPEFTELRLFIDNTSDKSFDDISLMIQPDVPVASITQITNVPNVSFEEKNKVSTRMMSVSDATGAKTAIQLTQLATNAGYTVRCSHLQAKASLTILMALANIKMENRKSRQPAQQPIQKIVSDKDYVMRVNMTDGSTYWSGHTDGDVYAQRPNPQQVKIEGQYRVEQDILSIAKSVKVLGHIDDVLSTLQ